MRRWQSGQRVDETDAGSAPPPKFVGRGPSLDRGRAGALPYGMVPLDAEDRAHSSRGLLAIARRDDEAPIGVLEYRVGYPAEGWLCVGFVAVEPPLRGLGFGSEAVRLLEEEALRRGLARRFCAEVPLGNGTGLYFWLRLGYRPVGPGEDHWPGRRPRGIIGMMREFENLGPRTAYVSF